MTHATSFDRPTPALGPAFPVPDRPWTLGFSILRDWWWASRRARALREAVVRLDQTSPHLLSDIGMADHPLASSHEAEAERAVRRILMGSGGGR